MKTEKPSEDVPENSRLIPDTDSALEGHFRKLCEIVVRLRGPGGCPWDIEQNPLSLRGDLVEETYECIEAISNADPPHIKEELGDIFLLVTMISYMHQEEGLFSIADVLEGVCEKLIRRHPHVFAGKEVKDSAEVLENWAKIKVTQEGRKPKDSILDEVKQGLPPLERAYKLQKKAARAGFDWPNVDEVFSKIDEELGEVREALECMGGAHTPPPQGGMLNSALEKLEDELGDLLFMAVNLCRFLEIEPSTALFRANTKFVKRFCHVEKRMKETGSEMEKKNLGLMDGFWEEAKAQR